MTKFSPPIARRLRGPRASALSCACLLAASSFLLPRGAPGQAPTPESNRSKSSALFQHAIEQMQQKNFDTACPELEESYYLSRLYGTLFTLAECHAQAGHVATASVRYGDFLELTSKLPEPEMIRQRSRREHAAEQKRSLEPLIPSLTLTLPDGVSPAQVVVKQNGRPVLASTLGVPLPTDPGKYRVTTQIEGGPEAEHQIEISPGQRVELKLRVLPAEKREQGLPQGAAPAAPSRPPPPAASHTAAYVVGGVGLLSLAAGAAAGVLSLAPAAEAKSHCRDGECDGQGFEAATRASTLRNVSLVSLAAGAAAAGVGVYLYVFPRGISHGLALTPAATPTEGQLLVRGTW
jgi:hypothetical protein